VTVPDAIRCLKNTIRRWIPRREFIISREQDALLRSLSREVASHLAARGPAPRVRLLYLPTHYLLTLTRMVDVIMALALRLRGADITPVLFDHLFYQQVFFGGLYGGNNNEGRQYVRMENKIWQDVLKARPLSINDYYREDDAMLAKKVAQKVNIDNYREFTYDGYPVGIKAGDVAANLNNLSKVANDADSRSQLKIHVENIIKLLKAYGRIFDEIQPEVIFSNIPFYYKWGAAYHVARKRNIPFYVGEINDRKNTIFFSCNTDKILDVSPAWPSFKTQELPREIRDRLDDLIGSRSQGEFYSYSPFPRPGQDTEDHRRFLSWLDRGKPLVFFPVNTLYDAAVYQESPAFQDALDMVRRVIAFFHEHPEYQLVIKAHPAEKLAYTTNSEVFVRSCLGPVLDTLPEKLADNIYFLDYDTKISTFDLIPLISLGILFTSSTAMEMAWAGKPVISVAATHYSGKGFTYEPGSQGEFFGLINKLLTEGEAPAIIQERIELSKKYYILYFYYARVDFNLFEGCCVGSNPSRLRFGGYEALLPGKSASLDYICDSIINRLPIYGDQRWPPLSL
jgi:hypothetical protein